MQPVELEKDHREQDDGSVDEQGVERVAERGGVREGGELDRESGGSAESLKVASKHRVEERVRRRTG